MDDCCDPHVPAGYEKEFDARYARTLAQEYRRDGLTPTSQRIVDFAASNGIDGASVLEIGGGIGVVQLELLKRGAARTTNVELSPAYETEARKLLDEAGMRSLVNRAVGVDIAVTPDAIEPADIVILNRVVCCYPDYGRLLDASARHARRALVFSHPPRNAFTRTAIWFENLWLRMRRNPFRSFVHSPEAMIGVLSANGLEPRYRHPDRVWCVVGAVRA